MGQTFQTLKCRWPFMVGILYSGTLLRGSGLFNRSLIKSQLRSHQILQSEKETKMMRYLYQKARRDVKMISG